MTRTLILLFIAAVARAESLDAILARMDAKAKTFNSMSANLRRQNYTAVIKETSEESGVMRLKRIKGGLSGIVQVDKPQPQTYAFSGHTMQIYYPKMNQVQVYEIGKYSGTVNQFLLLGFGTSGADLTRAYEIKAGEVESVDGVKATRLELVSKNPEVRKLFTKIEIWIQEGESYPIREKFSEPSHDYYVADYSDVKLNPSISDSQFELKVPPGTKKVVMK